MLFAQACYREPKFSTCWVGRWAVSWVFFLAWLPCWSECNCRVLGALLGNKPIRSLKATWISVVFSNPNKETKPNSGLAASYQELFARNRGGWPHCQQPSSRCQGRPPIGSYSPLTGEAGPIVNSRAAGRGRHTLCLTPGPSELKELRGNIHLR
jgi:hypothetical protein